MKQVILLNLLFVFYSAALANLEGDALHAFKMVVSDPHGMLETWDPTLINPCTWLYITCNEENSVIRVDLAHAGLSGSLVPELSNLKSLKYLELFNNKLTGSIPSSFGEFKQLISLDLQYNYLSGKIPTTLGRMPSLVFLRLNNNKLSGQIPVELTSISSLQVLDLSYNDLSGIVPKDGSFRHVTVESFKGNPGLCGQVLKKPCRHK